MASGKQEFLIGEILINKGIITHEQLDRALSHQKKEGGYICTVITRLGFSKPEDVFGVLADHLGVEFVDLKKEIIDPAAVDKVPAKLALHYELFPYRLEGKTLVVALADPLDIHKLDDLTLILDTKIKANLGYEPHIRESIQRYYGVGADILEDILAKDDAAVKKKDNATVLENIENAVADASIVKFVNQIFTQAVEERSTDIHLEPFENELRVRFRIDGFLYEVPIPESIKFFHQAIVTRVKIMSALDIAEHRMPQDGRIKLKIKKEEYDFRISILPSVWGESVQIRILSTRATADLDKIGLQEDDRTLIEELIEKPNGIIFVTGPTGSGKSTTLYACLSHKNTPDIKIITTEDPVEYQLRGITQMQVNPKVGLTFAEGLRCILRHDPDIVMVGEARDAETAEITIRSAMTGHLVFSTLHTNDAASAPARLIDMGIEPFLVASSLAGVIAQRLVRVICPDCKQKKDFPADVFKAAGFDLKETMVEIYEGKGCQFCRNTGYRGRIAIFEILLMTEEIRDLVFRRVTSQEIKEKALALGMKTLRNDGLRKVLKGITTLSEVMRVS